jgi:ribosomal protein S18 acetylase RimI-like enzyme
MALAPQFAAFEIADLRTVRARALGALFSEEERAWREELHWDYSPSVEMIRRHVEAQTLPGYIALAHGRVCGYCFFVYEDEKGLLGDLYVLADWRGEHPRGEAGIATLLVERALETLEHSPVVRRIEAQLIPFGLEPLAPVFVARGYEIFPRLFLYRAFVPADAEPARERTPLARAAVRAWDDRWFDPMAELIAAAYAGHVDSRINDHYSTRAGALRFLKNIVLFPGCGVFQADGSFGAVGAEGELLGAVLVSQVAPRIAHITQICVRPERQGRGLGRRLLEVCLERLARKGFRGVSLTVTAANEPAVTLYHRLGFQTLKEFSAVARVLR